MRRIGFVLFFLFSFTVLCYAEDSLIFHNDKTAKGEQTVASFLASNELEKALIQAQQKNPSVDEFLKVLMDSKIYIMIDKEVGEEGVWDNSTNIFMLANSKNEPRFAVFTSPERSDEWHKRAPKYQWGLQTDFKWVIKLIGPKAGVVVNPGYSVGCDIEPHIIQELKAQEK